MKKILFLLPAALFISGCSLNTASPLPLPPKKIEVLSTMPTETKDKKIEKKEEIPKPIISPVKKPLPLLEDDIYLFKQFKESYGENWVVRRDAKTGAVRRLSGKSEKTAGLPEDIARRFLEVNRSLFHLNPKDINMSEKSTTAGKHHVVFQQFYGKLPVEGKTVRVHLTEDNEIYLIQSGFLENLHPTTISPSITSDEALSFSLKKLGIKDTLETTPKITLVFYPEVEGGGISLAWKVEFSVKQPLGAWVLFIDAGSGRVIAKYDELMY